MLLVQITNMFCNHQNTLIMGDCNLGPTFESYMKEEFEMSMMGELNYFLGPQIK